MAWKTGIDIRVVPKAKIMLNKEGEKVVVPDKSDLKNYGPGKYLLYGPACHHSGKTIPCATFVWGGGGMIAEILVNILVIFNKFELFPRIEGAVPFILLNGHLTRLDPPLLSHT